MINSMDQASNLRKLASIPTIDRDHDSLISRGNPLFRTIAITSGKGGVGKTSLTANLGIALSQVGKRVIIFDADLGLANIDVLFDIHPTHNLKHVVSGEKRIDEILVRGPAGIKIVPASSGVEIMANLPEASRRKLLADLGLLSTGADLMIVDTAAGISENVVTFGSSADITIVIVTPDPASITDAYAIIKVMSRRKRGPFKLIINMVHSPEQAREVALSLIMVTQKFLGVKVGYLGFIPFDSVVPDSLKRQKPFLLTDPHSPAARHVRKIAQRIADNIDESGDDRGFFDRVSESFDPPLDEEK